MFFEKEFGAIDRTPHRQEFCFSRPFFQIFLRLEKHSATTTKITTTMMATMRLRPALARARACHHGLVTKRSSTTSSQSLTEATLIPKPTRAQLWNFFILRALPMVGFGFMDQTVMIQAGNAIDCSIGVTFGLSTLTAAAFGQICSDTAGVLFGSTVDSFFRAIGLPRANLSIAQKTLPIVKRIGLAASLGGIIFGCCLGLVNLLFIDTDRSSVLKLQAFNEENEFAFSIEASNADRDDATILTVRGPDMDGLLASMTAALTARGVSLKELHAARRPVNADDNVDASTSQEMIEDVFVVVQHGTKKQIPDDELDDLAQALLEATFAPVNVRSFNAQVKELEESNSELKGRCHKLEKLIQERQVKVFQRAITVKS
jgi:hypothetical protein